MCRENGAEQMEKRGVKCESNNSRGGETYLASRAVSLYVLHLHKS